MFELDIHRRLEAIRALFRECTPRILVVTDGGLNGGDGGFGLSHFLDVLGTTMVHGMTPSIVHRGRNDGGTDGAFDDLAITEFDVVFLFGIERTAPALGDDAVTRIKRFMQAGGGVFATGDHEDLGTGMSGQIPRVRAMRYWAAAETPDVADETRLTTNLPGDDNAYSFDDQSDRHPQRLYPNFAVGSDVPVLVPVGGVSPGRPTHPLLRQADGSALDVYPDHPHEGECRIPDDLSTVFELDGTKVPEWPNGGWFFTRPRPRAVAYAMSAGNGFTFGVEKLAVVPRSFITIAAYNGHVANVGRVVTDATWHHYVNINLNGMRPGGVSSADMLAIERYWANLVNWLMPADVRMCLWPWLVLNTLVEHPTFEELQIPDRFDPSELTELGRLVVAAVDEQPGSVGSDALTDALAVVGRNGEVDEPRDDAPDVDRDTVRGVAEALVGAQVTELARAIRNDDLRRGDERFRKIVAELAPRVVEGAVEDGRARLAREGAELDRAAELLRVGRDAA